MSRTQTHTDVQDGSQGLAHKVADIRSERRTRGVKSYANMSNIDLLDSYWKFVSQPLSPAASMLVSQVGGEIVAPFITGELAKLVQTAVDLQKAYGRTFSPDEVAHDLEIAVPTGFIPQFTLYLQAAGIRTETPASRKVNNDIKNAIRRRIADSRSNG